MFGQTAGDKVPNQALHRIAARLRLCLKPKGRVWAARGELVALSIRTTRMNRPVNWNSIVKDFKSSLLLGNGASIAANSRFEYKNLLCSARQLGLITSDLEEIFKYLETQDFELVLEMLWHTYYINDALGIRTTKAQTAYQNITAFS